MALEHCSRDTNPCFIHWLPVELIQAIFAHLQQPSLPAPLWAGSLHQNTLLQPHKRPVSAQRRGRDTKGAGVNSTVLLLSSVCRRWRQISLSRSSSLFITLPTRNPGATDQLITSLAPLSIKLSISGDECVAGGTEWKAVKGTLDKFGSRLRSVHLWLRDSGDEATLPSSNPSCVSGLLASCHAPSLQEYRAYCLPYPDGWGRPIRSLTIPPSAYRSLRVVELRGCRLTNPEVLVNSQLETSGLRPPNWTRDFDHPAFSRLQRLHLTAESLLSLIFAQGTARASPLRMPNLVEVHVSGCGTDIAECLRAIAFPKAASLSLRCEDSTRTSLEAITKRLEAHFADDAGPTFSTILVGSSKSSVTIWCRTAALDELLEPATTFSLCLSSLLDSPDRDDVIAGVVAMLPLRGPDLTLEVQRLGGDVVQQTRQIVRRVLQARQRGEKPSQAGYNARRNRVVVKFAAGL